MNEYFNWELKNEYSWLPKEITSLIMNIAATGRWSMLSALLSNREFISFLTNNQKFLKILRFVMNKKNAIKYTIKKRTINVWLSKIMQNYIILNKQ